MKKFVYSFGMFVAATMTFASCAKEISPETTEEITHVMTINVGKAVDSKTAVVEGETEATYKWSESDKQYFHVYESTTDGQGNETKTEGLVTEVFYSDDMSTASLSVSFTSSAEGPYTYTVIYANALNTNGNPVIPASQSPLVDNFDPAADVLISKPIVSQTRIDALDMTMGRVATINKMTLKGLDAGEKISKVEFALDKGLSASYVLGTGNYNTISKKLTMSYEAAAVASDGTFPVYFVSAPVANAAIESVVVTTDKKVYTKSSSLNPNPFEDKSISFAVGTMKRFGMDMEGYGEAISTGVTYIKATSLEDFGDSQNVIIVGTDGNSSYFTMGKQGDNNRSAVDITSSVNEAADEVILDNTSGAHTFILAKSGSSFTFLDTDETSGYLYAAGTSSGNYLRSKTEIGGDCYWNLTFNSANLEVKSVNNTYTPYMQYNSSQLFACYKGTSQKPVMIFVDASTKIQVLEKPQNLEAIAIDNSVMVSWDKVVNAQSYKVTCGERSSEVSASESPTVTFEGLADGLYEISVVATTLDASFKDSEPATTSVRVGEIQKSMAYFSVNGVTDAGTEYEEGATITFPENPTIDGVDFMGWTTTAIDTPQKNAPDYVSKAVMGRDDVTFYAVFATKYETEVTEEVQTLAYDTWTYAGSTTNKSSYRLFHSGSYIESAEFDLSKLSKVVVYGGTFGGTQYNSLTIGDGTNIWKSVTVSGSNQTGVNTYTNGTALTGTGKLRITSNSGTASDTGVRISKVEIYFTKGGYYYDDYCTNVVTLSSIAISGTPTKKEYTEGEEFNPSGLTVTGTYSDGNSKEISTGIIWTSNPNPLTEGTTSVTVTANVGSISSAAYEVTGLTVTAGSGGGEPVPYEIVFLTSSSDGNNTISESTKVSTVVETTSTGYITSFTSNCSKAYYNCKSGVKLGSSNGTGTLEFNLADVVKNNVVSIKVETAQYGTDAGTITMYNGSTELKSGITPGVDSTHEFASPTTVKSLKFVTSSKKRAYISKITITVAK